MQNPIGHIKPYRHILLLGLILFSLAPCGVKGTWMDSLDLTHSKSLNKSRTTTASNSCQFPAGEVRQNLIVKEVKFLESTGFSEYGAHHTLFELPKGNKVGTKTGSGQGPPKYILFKCLKIAAA